MSCLSEVTNLPLLKIFAYIDFSRVEFVLPPMVYEWGNGGRYRGLLDELESNMFFSVHIWCPSCLNGLRGSRVMSN